MNLGKCHRCNKTVYQNEGFRVGPPGKELTVHKACFSCQNEGCTWKLDLRSYYYYEGKVYCKAHNAMTGTSNTTHATGKFDTNTVELAAAAKSQAIASEPAKGKGGREEGGGIGVWVVLFFFLFFLFFFLFVDEWNALANVVGPQGVPHQGFDKVTTAQFNAPKKDVEKGVGVGGGRSGFQGI